MKAFLTTSVDKLRLPYDKGRSRWQRRTVFYASVNPEEFLQDETGNRRFWIIPVEDIKFKNLPNMRDLWRLALHWYQQGEQHYLTREERYELDLVNLEYRTPLAYEAELLALFDPSTPLTQETYSAQHLLNLLGISDPKTVAQESRKIGRAVKAALPTAERGRTSKGVFWRLPRRREASTEAGLRLV